jgi:hypothetical protein
MTYSDTSGPSNFWNWAQYNFHRLPRAYGFDPHGLVNVKGLITTGTSYAFNTVGNHPITWVSMCFVGTRGSVNWTANCTSSTTSAISTPSFFFGRYSTLSAYGISAQNQPGSATISAIALWALSAHRFNSAAGLALTNPQTCSMLTAACPMYSAYKFQTTDKSNITAASSEDDSQLNSFVLNVRSFNGGWNGFELYAAIGTDFNVHLFLNVPTLWVYTTDPLPA